MIQVNEKSTPNIASCRHIFFFLFFGLFFVHIYIYIYIYMCVCVCVCDINPSPLQILFAKYPPLYSTETIKYFFQEQKKMSKY